MPTRTRKPDTTNDFLARMREEYPDLMAAADTARAEDTVRKADERISAEVAATIPLQLARIADLLARVLERLDRIGDLLEDRDNP